ncbi:hypothetical protein [Rhodococcus sp. WB9]|nr:hypothetical protein [Rhodococcus sp. WB9]
MATAGDADNTDPKARTRHSGQIPLKRVGDDLIGQQLVVTGWTR